MIPNEMPDAPLHRTGHLESQLRSMRRWLRATQTALLIVVIWLALQKAPAVYPLGPVAIQDRNGRVIVDIARYTNGEYGLSLRRPKGGTLASLFSDGKTPNLCLYDAKDKNRMRVCLREDTESPEIILIDAAQVVRAMLSLAPDGSPYLSFFDAKQKNRMVIGLAESGTPDISVFDSAEKGQFVLYATDEGLPAIDFMSDKDSSRRSFVWHEDEGRGFFQLASKESSESSEEK